MALSCPFGSRQNKSLCLVLLVRIRVSAASDLEFISVLTITSVQQSHGLLSMN